MESTSCKDRNFDRSAVSGGTEKRARRVGTYGWESATKMGNGDDAENARRTRSLDR